MSLVILSRRRRIHTLILWILRCAQYDRVGQKPSRCLFIILKKRRHAKGTKSERKPKKNHTTNQNPKIQRVAFKAESKSRATTFLFKEKAGKKPKSRLKSRAKSPKRRAKAEPSVSHKRRSTKSQLHTQKSSKFMDTSLCYAKFSMTRKEKAS